MTSLARALAKAVARAALNFLKNHLTTPFKLIGQPFFEVYYTYHILIKTLPVSFFMEKLRLLKKSFIAVFPFVKVRKEKHFYLSILPFLYYPIF